MTTKQAMRIFGVLSYVRAFSGNFAAMTQPIVEAIKNGNKQGTLTWGKMEQDSLQMTVDELKRSSKLYRVKYGPTNDLYIFSDASKYSISAVMSQVTWYIEPLNQQDIKFFF